MGIPDARTVSSLSDRARIRYAGIAICRQRPSTASGVTFMTLEDETGFVNLVIWKRVFEQFEVIVKTASFLGVEGRIQKKDNVTHLIAEALFVPTLPRHPETVTSRDFR